METSYSNINERSYNSNIGYSMAGCMKVQVYDVKERGRGQGREQS